MSSGGVSGVFGNGSGKNKISNNDDLEGSYILLEKKATKSTGGTTVNDFQDDESQVKSQYVEFSDDSDDEGSSKKKETNASIQGVTDSATPVEVLYPLSESNQSGDEYPNLQWLNEYIAPVAGFTVTGVVLGWLAGYPIPGGVLGF